MDDSRRRFLADLLAMAGVALVGVPACRSRPPRLAPVPATLEERLAAYAVADDDHARTVFYSWTTPAAVGELRASRRLLVATATSGGLVSPYSRALAWFARHPGPARAMARLLTGAPGLNRRRYAWPAPFATVMGAGARTYGTALVRIELRPEAWIARFEPAAAAPFSFVDTAGAPVAAAAVLADPGRLAAIYHVRTESSLEVRFREYVICNEAMVAAWSVATPAIRAEVEAEIAVVRELRDRLDELDEVELAAPAWPAWARAPGGGVSLAARWRSALAFDNRRYQLARDRLDAILAALAAYDGAGEPLEVALASS